MATTSETSPSESAAQAAITQVLYRYCRSMDRIDAELGYLTWHDDGTAHYSGLYEGSGRGFIDWVCELHRPMVATSHQVTNILIEVDGDTAASEAYVTVRLRTDDGSGNLIDIVGAGRYLDQWSYRDGRWAIDHRQYVSDVSTNLPAPASDARAALAPAGSVDVVPSHRDRSDPSYALFGDESA
jgi:hypothetical protein